VIRYYITDSRELGGVERLIPVIARLLLDGVDLVQIREKHLGGRELYELTRRVLELANPHGSRILVNSRVDVALAAGAHGVHLGSDSITPGAWRRITGDNFLIGVSCHRVSELRRAEEGGADFAVYSPIFPTNKPYPVEPKGLDALRAATRAVKLPVLALGGVTERTAPLCVAAGAAGVAGIRLFQS
jgi:thiamine-phosphate pyrophosphorylase